ncbi:hypothetical protein DXG01_007087 [Tephrocybe rancida]|nr:hypothetical protein DXG01_007087 [Tephrocybe rancida]
MNNSSDNSKLVDCPVDVLLEITSHLKIQDVFSFLTVCSSFRRLGDEQSLWSKLLERTETRRPVACPPGTDFSKLNIEESRRILRHTERLEKNWDSILPMVYGSASLPHIDNLPLDIVAVFPGASAVVISTVTSDSELLILGSFGSKPVVRPFCEMDLLVHHTTTIVGGRLCLACVIQPLGSQGAKTELHIYHVALGLDGTPHVDLNHQMSFDPLNFSHLFISQDVFGYIRVSDSSDAAMDLYDYLRTSEPGSVALHLYNFTADISVVVSLDSMICMANEVKVAVSPDGAPIVTETLYNGSSRIYRCPSKYLPYGSCAPQGDFTVQMLGQVNPSYIINNPNGSSSIVNKKLVHWSPLGVHMFVDGYYVDSISHLFQSSYTAIYFWPADEETNLDIYNNSRVARIELLITHRINTFSESGRYAVVYPEQWSSHRELYLLQFYPGIAPCIDAKKITLPTSLPKSLPGGRVGSIAIDERLGKVFLYYDTGAGPQAVAVHFHEP